MQIQTTLGENRNELNVTTEDGKNMKFQSVWLRFNCHCPACIHPHTLSNLKNTAEVNVYSTIESTQIKDNGTTLTIKWTDHEGEIPIEFLQDKSTAQHEGKTRHSWIKKQAFPKMSYDEVVGSKTGLLNWLRKINDDGLCLLTDVPTEPSTVLKVAGHVGPIHRTVYGDVFHVKNEPTPTHIAYTSEALPYHMDLSFYESPAVIQFLHCMQFDDCVTGGDNILLDAFHVAEIFRKEHPEDFHILTKIPAVFEHFHFKRDWPINMACKRPHIILNENQEIITVNWAPHHEGPLPLSTAEEDILPYFKAYQKFAKALNDSEDKIVYKLKPGELLALNNRRTMHGRTKYQLNGGARWLEGCYVLFDLLVSQIKVLSMQTGDKRPLKIIGNQV